MPSIHLPAARADPVRFREGGRRHAGLVRIKLHYEAAVHTAPGSEWTARSLRVACSGDIDEVVRLMHDCGVDVRQGNARTGRRADRPDIRGDLRPEIRA
ncbi:hypothetical protein ECZU23_53870 [Escherichia coli]|nr:hypothetical protein ECZU23_53870 [Escherichia coli]